MDFRLVRILPLLLAIFAFSLLTFAQDSGDRTQVGHDITIGPNEQASDVTCFGCSVRVRGQVHGDVTTFGGGIVVEPDAQVAGDTTSFGGDVRLESGTSVHDVTVFGGKVRRDSSASVEGDITNFSGSYWIFLIFGLPLLLLAAFIGLIVWLVRRLLNHAAPVAAQARQF